MHGQGVCAPQAVVRMHANPLPHHTPLLPPSSGEVRMYNGKALVHTHTLPSVATALWFGRYGREENTLVTVRRGPGGVWRGRAQRRCACGSGALVAIALCMGVTMVMALRMCEADEHVMVRWEPGGVWRGRAQRRCARGNGALHG